MKFYPYHHAYLGQVFQAYLFDVYHLEDIIYLWFLDKAGEVYVATDKFYPEIYASGSGEMLQRLAKRLVARKVLYEKPCMVERNHFYSNKKVKVARFRFSKPSFLRNIHNKLYALIDKLDIYHSDFDISTNYMYTKGVFPSAFVEVTLGEELAGYHRLSNIRLLDKLVLPDISSKNLFNNRAQLKENFEYTLPPLKVLSLRLKYSHRIGLRQSNPLILQSQVLGKESGENKSEPIEISGNSIPVIISKLNKILKTLDPDVILSSFGDQIIFPALFKCAQENNIELYLDRDPMRTTRKIITKGSSFNTYGNMIYRAPSYPLFGRWHIDSANSFVFKESELIGIIELSRMSRLPVQRMSRSSTGTALTYIETDMALRMNYLVPWQKSSVEEAKTAYDLLQIDKGGLVFEPDIRNGNVYENVVQLDFAQMYPTIMVIHNISPETVLCQCCREGYQTNQNIVKVPEAGYHICNQRAGVVSKALAPVLERRRFWKEIKNNPNASELEKNWADARQKAIKWLLVTSFGYLGYRNAKFGRLESHESVTAFGRDKLLRAKEISEDNGFSVLNAITDCLFIQKIPFSSFSELDSEIKILCKNIFEATGVEISNEGVYRWLVFVPSRLDKKLPVSNRYFGRFSNGQLKVRGIMVRRKDVPIFIRHAQSSLLEVMASCENVAELRANHGEMESVYLKYDQMLKKKEVPWHELLLRKTVGKSFDNYSVQNATYLSLEQLKKENISVEPGEKIKYLIIGRNSSNQKKRYLSEESCLMKYGAGMIPYDMEAYRKLLWESFEEIWESFAPDAYFKRFPNGQGDLFFDYQTAQG
jgi:DNA polymerase-2